MPNDSTVALMSMDDRVLHMAGNEHGKAECGEWVRDPWRAGPLSALVNSAVVVCEDCFD